VFNAVPTTGRRTPIGGVYGEMPTLMMKKALMSAMQNITTMAYSVPILNAASECR
jgi:hypothetical protein